METGGNVRNEKWGMDLPVIADGNETACNDSVTKLLHYDIECRVVLPTGFPSSLRTCSLWRGNIFLLGRHLTDAPRTLTPFQDRRPSSVVPFIEMSLKIDSHPDLRRKKSSPDRFPRANYNLNCFSKLFTSILSFLNIRRESKNSKNVTRTEPITKPTLKTSKDHFKLQATLNLVWEIKFRINNRLRVSFCHQFVPIIEKYIPPDDPVGRNDHLAKP
ncbi:hypothetical protein P5673_027466 [Acropora cervicornis]|uniref:Uncharacterized protein n=1 Tax=Acropora cervicornis TaxID=6130 RepID=A0AAD9UVP2_ACRCE|nr:hypothetical protein P5673_027466 [Acropora cervicornis]